MSMYLSFLDWDYASKLSTEARISTRDCSIPLFIYLFIYAARAKPYELWQGSSMEGPEPFYASLRT